MMDTLWELASVAQYKRMPGDLRSERLDKTLMPCRASALDHCFPLLSNALTKLPLIGQMEPSLVSRR